MHLSEIYALQIAAKLLQIATLLILTTYRNLPSPNLYHSPQACREGGARGEVSYPGPRDV